MRAPRKNIADSVTLTDVSIRGANKTLSDSQTLTDARTGATTKQFSDNYVLTENEIAAFTKRLADTLTLADLFAYTDSEGGLPVPELVGYIKEHNTIYARTRGTYIIHEKAQR